MLSTYERKWIARQHEWQRTARTIATLTVSLCDFTSPYIPCFPRLNSLLHTLSFAYSFCNITPTALNIRSILAPFNINTKFLSISVPSLDSNSTLPVSQAIELSIPPLLSLFLAAQLTPTRRENVAQRSINNFSNSYPIHHNEEYDHTSFSPSLP